MERARKQCFTDPESMMNNLFGEDMLDNESSFVEECFKEEGEEVLEISNKEALNLNDSGTKQISCLHASG